MSKATRSWSGKKILFALMLSASAAWLLSINEKDLSQFSTVKLQVSELSGHEFPKTLTNALGQAQIIQQPVTRISSTVLAADEMLVYLNETQRARSVTYLVDDRRISIANGHYDDTIGRIKLNTELILRDQPDLIVVAPFIEDETVRLLSSSGATLLRMGDFHTFQDIETNFRLLAGVIGESGKAEILLNRAKEMLSEIERIIAQEPKPRVLAYSLSGSTAGIPSVTDEMITRAGGHNVVRETNLSKYPRISQEQAIALQPDVILMSAWDDSSEDAAAVLFADPAWQSVPAIKHKRVYVTDSAFSSSISPARFDGTLMTAKLLHPKHLAELNQIQPLTEQFITDGIQEESSISSTPSDAVR